MLRRSLAIVLIASSFALALGCSGVTSFSGEAYLYVVAPLTGDMSSRGQEIAGGVRLRADEVNKTGGLLGRKIVVRALDDGGDADTAIEAAKQVGAAIKKGDTVLGVVGHYNSGATGPALDNVYKDLDIVVITPGSSNPTLTQKGYTKFFRVVSTDDIQGPVDARKALAEGWKKIVVMHTDNLYALGLGQAFSDELRKSGVQPLADIEMKYNNTGVYLRELGSNVQKALAKSPDGIFFAGDYPEGIPLVEALRDAGYKGNFMTGDSVMEYEFIDSLGSKAEGVIISNIAPEMAAVATEEWKAAYRQVENRSPGMDSITGYAAAHVLLEGVKAADTNKGAAVAEKLRKLELDTLVGKWSSDNKGDMKERKIYLFRITKGAFQQIGVEK
ncbi:MAG: branched-chain amino acid ABC transporter substrate-binding protein [Dehalococcoidia bacterium]|nr:branched-chain amino acid ABC transporter substrate-binding protein [Dehalococcoidia bacterium]